MEQEEGEVTLNPADRSLDCQLDGPFASTLSDEGFGYLWSGVRATHGITAGRFWFSVRVLQPLETTLPNIGDSADLFCDEDATANTINCCRVGVSRLSADVGSLGTHNSWGYGSTGKKSTGNTFSNYPGPHCCSFGPGDEVACFVDLSRERGSPCISFAVNCQMLGRAFELMPGSALFPHVLLKNMAVVVNFKGEQPQHWPAGEAWNGTWADCLPWQASLTFTPPAVRGPSLRPFQQCQVIMMVGLPGAGKSYQAARLMGGRQQHGARTLLQQQQQQEHHSLMLSPESIVRQMKVMSKPRRGGAAAAAARVSELLGLAEEVFERLLDLAAQHPANYIIDSCKYVRAHLRRQRLAIFRAAGFKLVAGVVVEQDAVLSQRLRQREHQVRPALEDVLDLKANFTLPEVSTEEFDEVQFLGSITQPHDAAVLVAGQRQSAQLQLKQLGWQQDGSCRGFGRPTENYGMNFGGNYGVMYGPDPARSCSMTSAASDAQGIYYADRASSSSSGGSFASSRRNSSTGLQPHSPSGAAAAGAGFTPYTTPYTAHNAALFHGLYRPPAPQTPAYPAPYPAISRECSTFGAYQGPPAAGSPPGYPQPGAQQQQQQYSMSYGASRQYNGSKEQIGTPPHQRRTSSSSSSEVAGMYQQQHGTMARDASGSNSSSMSGAASLHAKMAGTFPPSLMTYHGGPHQHQQQHQPAGRDQFGGSPYSQQQQQQHYSLPYNAARQYSNTNGTATPPRRNSSSTGGGGCGTYLQQNGAGLHSSSSGGSSLRGSCIAPPLQGRGQSRASPRASPAMPSSPLPGSPLVSPLPSYHQQMHAVASLSHLEQSPGELIAAAFGNGSRAAAGHCHQPAQRRQPQGPQQQNQHQNRQQKKQQGKGTSSSRRAWGAPAAAAAAAAAAGDGADEKHGSSTQEFPSLTACSSLTADSTQMECDQDLQQHQQAALSPFAACQSLHELLQPSSSLCEGQDKPSSTPQGNGSAAGSAATSSQAATPPTPQPQSEQPRQQQGQQQTHQLQQQQQRHNKAFYDSLRGSFASNSSAGSEAEPVQLSLDLQRKLQELQLCCLCGDALVAAVMGQGPSGKPSRRLGKGSYGVVLACSMGDLLATSSSSGSGGDATAATAAAAAGAADSRDDTVAVKVLQPNMCTSEAFLRELEVLVHARHQHLVALQGYCLTKRALVFEYCSRGSLEDWLAGHASITGGRFLSWQQRLAIAQQVSSALLYLHSHTPEPIMHRDIKPNNILIAGDMSARLADLGLGRLMPVNRTSVETNTVGCLYYLPEEFIVRGVASCAVDVYMFGLVLANMLTGDTREHPRALLWRLAEKMAGFEDGLRAAAEMAAAAAAAAAGGGSHGCSSSKPPRTGKAGAPLPAAAGAAGTAVVSAAGSVSPPRSYWWLGVMANCSSRGSGSSFNRSSSCSNPMSPRSVSTNPTSPASAGSSSMLSPASSAAGGANSRSWVTVAAAAACRLQGDGASSSGAAAGAGAAVGSVGPAVAAATELPAGLGDVLDNTAGVWPPRVAVGLVMLALACCEQQRSNRPTTQELVSALTALQRLAEQQEQQSEAATAEDSLAGTVVGAE